MDRSVVSFTLLFLFNAIQVSKQQITHTQMFVPIRSLEKVDICSIMSIAFPLTEDSEWDKRVNHHHSRRTMLAFLLSIQETPNNEQVLEYIQQCYSAFDWKQVETTYRHLKQTIEGYQTEKLAQKLGKYWELHIKGDLSARVLASREYISRRRSDGFHADELKLYWNYAQIQAMVNCPDNNRITDKESRKELLGHPVRDRVHSGMIHFHITGIENAVFQVPSGKQVIVLDFADERMPGGYYLENASTQEEVILYNSDGYRALLDLKYTMMDGGYIIPEYGVAYVKRVRFFQKINNEERLTDLIVAACYDLSSAGQGLYKPPSRTNTEELRDRIRRKFRAIIASAVANTEGDGKDTYLLLGPIGTGAFQNDHQMIAESFFEILNNPLMDSQQSIRYAFDQIWFVSIDSLKVFEDVFQKS